MIYWLSDYFRTACSAGLRQRAFGVAVAATVLFFVSLLLHELGHALVARRTGIGIAGIDLWLFGGVAKLTPRPEDAEGGVPRRRRRARP